MSPKGSERAQNNGKQRVGKPFPKGVSGNPGGRPAASKDFRDKCRQAMEAKDGGWDAAIDFLKTGRSRDRQWAIEFLAAYAYGRPKQTLDLGGTGKPIEFVEVVKRVG